MRKVSTYILIGIELVGVWLITQHRYMGFRSSIFMVMGIIGIVYFLCETILRVVKINAVADIESEIIPLNEEDFEKVKEIVEEIEDRK